MLNKIDVAPWPIEDDDKPDNMNQEFRIHGKCHVTGKNNSWSGGRMTYGYLGDVRWSIGGYDANNCCTPTHWELI